MPPLKMWSFAIAVHLQAPMGLKYAFRSLNHRFPHFLAKRSGSRIRRLENKSINIKKKNLFDKRLNTKLKV